MERKCETNKVPGREILPGLRADLPGDEHFRVWVAACVTGEEAYCPRGTTAGSFVRPPCGLRAGARSRGRI
jgi:hypothetical protein